MNYYALFNIPPEQRRVTVGEGPFQQPYIVKKDRLEDDSSNTISDINTRFEGNTASTFISIVTVLKPGHIDQQDRGVNSERLRRSHSNPGINFQRTTTNKGHSAAATIQTNRLVTDEFATTSNAALVNHGGNGMGADVNTSSGDSANRQQQTHNNDA